MFSRIAYHSIRRVFKKVGLGSFYLTIIHPYLSPKESVIKTEDGKIFFIDPRYDNIQRHLFVYRKPYEQAVTRWLKANVSPGMSVIEIGAHIGFHAVEICRLVTREGRVVLVEPLPTNYLKLKRNLEANNQDWAQCLQLAISDNHGKVKIRNSKDGAITSLHSKNHDRYGMNTVEVQTITLDELLLSENMETLDLLQLDVEGAEAIILNEKQLALSEKRISTILCEFHGMLLLTNFSVHPTEFIERVQSFGYEISELLPTGLTRPLDLTSFDPQTRCHLVFH